ncbi:MAG: serine hydrolase [Acidimicrobiia bacterium]
MIRTTLRSFAILVSIAMALISITPDRAVAADSTLGPFTDDNGHPGEPYLEWLAGLGAVEGCDPPANTRICPDRVLNRAEAAKIVVVLGLKIGGFPPIPTDLTDRFVDDDEIWAGAASRLASYLAHLRIIDGCDPPTNRRFCPTDPLKRGQVAKILVGAFGLTAPGSYSSPWTDTAGHFYDRAARVGAYHGMWDSSDGRFSGGEVVSRAEFARAIVLALGDDPCPPNPFTAAKVDSLDRRFPNQSFTAYAYDTTTGCAYWMKPDTRLRTASVFKVMVMAGTLLEAQSDGRGISSWEDSQLVPMITESANNPVRALWNHFGGSPWFRRQAELFGLAQTSTVGDTESGWGRTTTSAKDQGDLIRQVLLGDWGPIEETYRDHAWDLMTSVVDSQTWGVTEGVPAAWTVAQKNGFAGHIANSVGFVRPPDGVGGYVVAVLTNGWSSWERGVPTVEEIAGWVSEALAR